MLYNVQICIFYEVYSLTFLLKIEQKSALLMFEIAKSLRFIDIINKSWHLLQTFGWNLNS